ncbi:hypothetical protein, partial [Salmonella sp. s55044]|uniref:hypothetical protein n=1 Tax=Salmonella sp. s55044 TaxID=3159677 RepID=UPI003980C3A2
MYTNLEAHLALYILSCIVFALQLLFSIIGSSFTCGAVCCSESSVQNQQPTVIYQVSNNATGQYMYNPYTVVAAGGNLLTTPPLP